MKTDKSYICCEPSDSPLFSYSDEEMVLNSILSSFVDFCDVKDILFPECFCAEHHRAVFSAIMASFNDGERPDIISVRIRLKKMGAEISSEQFFKILEAPAATDLFTQAQWLRELAYRRRLRDIANSISRDSADPSVPIEKFFYPSLERLQNICDENDETVTDFDKSYELLQDLVLENMSRPENELFGTPTGFQFIDSKGGLCPGDLNVVGAETSQGKTSFATSLCLSAISHGHPVAFYSMEMRKCQLTARIASMCSGIPASKILYEPMTMADLHAMDASMAHIDKSLLHFDESTSSSLDKILTSIRSMKMKYDIKGAVVDYLQLINCRSEPTREQSVARCARELKNLATELGIWIIAISQLSRSQNGDAAPTLSRLRDSGQIEEAADNIYLIYRPKEKQSYPEPYTDFPTRGSALVMVKKGRNSGVGSFLCGFKPECTLFYPASEAFLKSQAEEDDAMPLPLNSSFA